MPFQKLDKKTYVSYLQRQFNFVPKIVNDLETQIWIRMYIPNEPNQTIDLVEYWFYKSKEPDVFLIHSSTIDHYKDKEIDFKPKIEYFYVKY